MSDEEVQRVTDAIAEIEHIADPEARVRAKSLVMSQQVKRNKEWAAERREMILKLHDEEGLSYRKIAERLGCTLSVVQDVFRGYTGSGSHRPKMPPQEGSTSTDRSGPGA